MAALTISIRLIGGPLDGRSATSGADMPLADSLELLNLSNLPTPLADPDAQVPYTVCFYDHAGKGRYEFKRSSPRTMESGRYLALKSAEAQLEKIQALITDPRLIQGRQRLAVPADAFTLGEGKRMKAETIATIRRRHKTGGEPMDDLTDEQVWALIRGAAKTDIGWAMMGSQLHLEGMGALARELFEIEMPARPEE